jgi:hypothetical protein
MCQSDVFLRGLYSLGCHVTSFFEPLFPPKVIKDMLLFIPRIILSRNFSRSLCSTMLYIQSTSAQDVQQVVNITSTMANQLEVRTFSQLSLQSPFQGPFSLLRLMANNLRTQ